MTPTFRQERRARAVADHGQPRVQPVSDYAELCQLIVDASIVTADPELETVLNDKWARLVVPIGAHSVKTIGDSYIESVDHVQELLNEEALIGRVEQRRGGRSVLIVTRRVPLPQVAVWRWLNAVLYRITAWIT